MFPPVFLLQIWESINLSSICHKIHFGCHEGLPPSPSPRRFHPGVRFTGVRSQGAPGCPGHQKSVGPFGGGHHGSWWMTFLGYRYRYENTILNKFELEKSGEFFFCQKDWQVKRVVNWIHGPSLNIMSSRLFECLLLCEPQQWGL